MEEEIIAEILRLSKNNLSELHVKILIKFFNLKGQYLGPNKIKGEIKDGKRHRLPPDEMVNELHQLHNLVRGVFPMKGSKYALSIYSNPKTKWKLEINRDHPTLRINYNFGQNPKYKSDITQLENCYKNDVPIGIIFRTAKTKNKILGLSKNCFV